MSRLQVPPSLVRTAAALSALAIIGAGCVTSPTLSATAASGVLALPTAAFPQACRGVGIDGVLLGDLADPRIAWLETTRNRAIKLVWPPGYSAHFDPDLEVLDSNGQVVFRAGDRVIGGCVKGPPDALGSVLLIRPADLAR